MHRRVANRAAAMAAAAALVVSGVAFADTIGADGDSVNTGVQTFVPLGTVAPGATVQRDVTMTLSCAGLRHVDPGQVVTVAQGDIGVPVAGGSIAATSTTVGPVPDGWANDTAGLVSCSGPMAISSAEPSHVTIVAPTEPGVGYLFSVTYSKVLTPGGVSDSSSLSGVTIVTFSLDVADPDTTPPTIVGLPGDLDLVTTDPAGVVLDYTLPTATDDRDPAPTVTCDPAAGDVAQVGETTVTCTATDATGNSTSGSFSVVVHLATVVWEDPVGGDGAMTVTRGRSVPVKAQAWLDGEPFAGAAGLEVWGCGARATGPERTAEATWQPDSERWMTVLDTSGLATGCHAVGLVLDGLTLGSFTLDVLDPPASSPAKGPSPHRRR